MLSIGLHLRMIGRPARIGGLEKILKHLIQRGGVWIARRDAIARHWLANVEATLAMTEQMAGVAARCLPEGVTIASMTATHGVPVIASREAYGAAASETVKMHERYDGRHEAVIIGCFGDPGLEALREAGRAPVLGTQRCLRGGDPLDSIKRNPHPIAFYICQ